VKIHEKYIQRCINWPKWLGHNLPNPMVGSVIVYENRIIGKAGIKAGEPHAEVNAINSVKDKSY
jgi:diaminohydroxyphosphoribosylaminopyrimidine deaminase/5-amino-6-(5-phosphoribosylamino)uracil reductase